jgi:crossover junction endodeoxyribonuclease RuvC
MIILGLDPGTTRAGYGLVQIQGGKAQLLEAGLLKVPSKGDKADILEAIRSEIVKLCAKHEPKVIAIEKLFFAKNRKTALAVAEARGVMLMAAREAGADIHEYSPNEVKIAVTGYGGADKKAVLKMVRLILKAPDLKVIDDASDALAIALTAGQNLYRTKAR